MSAASYVALAGAGAYVLLFLYAATLAACMAVNEFHKAARLALGKICGGAL